MLNPTRYQTYEEQADGSQGATRLAALRNELRRRGLDGLIVPRGDEHQGEYVAPHDDRLAYLAGFTGSAGAIVVTLDQAIIFVDGRYTLQVRDQVDMKSFEARNLITEPPSEWLRENVKPGQKIAYDPRLHTPSSVDNFAKALKDAGGTLVAVETNPLDSVWSDQPKKPLGKIEIHKLEFAGVAAPAKRMQIAEAIQHAKADTVVLTLPESIAWLLNIRGADVKHTPVPHSFATLGTDGQVDLFIDRQKLSPEVEAHLGNGVRIRPPEELAQALHDLGSAKKKVLADPSTASAWVFDQLTKGGATIIRGVDPVLLPKACKNPTEVQGIRNAHERDGAALTRFIRWLKTEGPSEKYTEIEACEKLEDFRRETGSLKDLSFDSISGAGSDGAIVHYRVTRRTDRRIKNDELFLIDSGGQYEDGTTDVTRTAAIGTPTVEQRDRFTRVLKGHIALARARFPEGTTGSQLDTLARMPLWEAGLDYDHGTGHGVGCYLSVHEGPQSISKRPISQALLPGMVCSNEPGYYKTGSYGIRIENLIVVTPAVDVPGGERKLMSFETVTLAPIDLDLVEPGLLTEGEKLWLNEYHRRVRETLTPMVDSETAKWLVRETRAL